MLIEFATGLLPVLTFLLALVYLDSYKLVRLRAVVLTILGGAVIAAVSYVVNGALIEASGLELRPYSRYVAPVVEELLKAIVIVVLLRSNRIGFLVDAAIFGFAAGTGFALVENLYYLNRLSDAHLGVWIVRGFGTAILHGGTAAIVGIVARTVAERRGQLGPLAVAAGLVPAILLHAFFNQFFLSPLLSAVLVILLLPPLLALVFRRSELALQAWLGSGFDEDVELLATIHSGEFPESRPGRYLQLLAARFPGEVVVDMLCYLRLYLELAIRAKGELMMRESGFRNEVEPEVWAKFEEMKFLEASIGKTGRAAMRPFLHLSGRELWQLYLLGKR